MTFTSLLCVSSSQREYLQKIFPTTQAMHIKLYNNTKRNLLTCKINFQCKFTIIFLWYSNFAWWWLFVLKPKHVALNVYNNKTKELSRDWLRSPLYSAYPHYNRVPLLRKVWAFLFTVSDSCTKDRDSTNFSMTLVHRHPYTKLHIDCRENQKTHSAVLVFRITTGRFFKTFKQIIFVAFKK
jgi:hypothetical protein